MLLSKLLPVLPSTGAAEVKKLMGEGGIKQKDQMHHIIAKGMKTIQHLRVAINVKCCSLISDI